MGGTVIKKPDTITTRIAVGMIACIGAPILLSGCSKHPVDSSIGSTDSLSGTADAPTVTYKVICDNVEGDLQTKSEGTDHIPSMTLHPVSYSQFEQSTTIHILDWESHAIMEAENGWYFHESYPRESGEGDGTWISYADSITGESVVLCAKPECTHTNEYCVASNTKYQGLPSVYYENYLYGIAYNTEKMQEFDPNGDFDHTTKAPMYNFELDRYGEITLVRYAPDGTELTALCSLENVLGTTLDGCSFENVSIIGHKGALWIGVSFRRERMLDAATFERSYAYGLLHYEISTGKLTTVAGMDLHVCDMDSAPSAPMDLRAVGDYVYFRKENKNWSDPLNGDRLYRVNIRSGAVEEVLRDVQSYAISGNKIFYLEYQWLSGAARIGVPKVYDLLTQEETAFLGSDTAIAAIQCTEDYVFLIDHEKHDDGTITSWLSVYNHEGEQLCRTEIPPTDDVDMTPAIAVHGDKLYYAQYHAVQLASVQDILNTGKIQWETVYQR